MYIGRFSSTPLYQAPQRDQRRSALPQVSAGPKSQAPQRDRVDLGNHSRPNSGAGICRPSQMQPIPAPVISESASKNPPNDDFVDLSTVADLNGDFSYTEEDALMAQYMKQYRVDGYRIMDENGALIQNPSQPPIRLILPDMIPQEDLDRLKEQLIKNGLGEEIDWRTVSETFFEHSAFLSGREDDFMEQVDHIASQYAVLKDRIQSQYTGDRQASEMQKLEEIYAQAKGNLADTYAKKVGGFFEDLGQTGISADMRESVYAAVDGKAEEYSACLAQNDIYGAIADPKKQWLKQDHAYMAARLREIVSASQAETKPQGAEKEAAFRADDLQFAGVFAGELSHELYMTEKYGAKIIGSWNASDINGQDAQLGKAFAELVLSAEKKADRTGISDQTLEAVKHSLSPFLDKFMDALDKHIDQNAGRPLFRLRPIDREEVYRAFQEALDGWL